MVRITLDAETFKALASPTRLTVLRSLDERRKTLTEISRDLSLNKATVHEHLQLLTAAELVRKRDDEGRKWIYYELTWRGQKLLHPQETTTFNVLLGLGVAAAGGGMAMLARALYVALETNVPPLTGTPEGELDRMTAPMADAPEQDSPAPASSTQTSTSTSGPSAGASTASGTPTHDAAPAAALVANDTGTTSTSPPADHSFLDDGGTLGLALLGFAALMALLAWLLRRHLRADPFQPPPGPPES
ncbi:MAG: winged helix-turn-helix domain-containing protein [Halobacteriales archaeon]|nr:winged helix-turn-helix domain-containing protein [Halobacteriales archaeon]